MPRYFIQLSYNGTAYHGWQVQENTKLTVQETLNEMLSRLLNQAVSVTGCGRTDTGVHAKDFYAHFDADADLLSTKEKWIFRFNQALPADIAISAVYRVKDDANSRFDAVSRTYEYRISRKKDPFGIDAAWFLYGHLDMDAMNKAAALLFDHTDFSSFAKSNTQSFTNNCRIYKAEWNEEGDLLVFTISADRFLRNMVRAIVGTLAEVGKGKMSTEEFTAVIESRNRSNAGFSVPACGLYLARVAYPEGYFKEYDQQ
ncbi:MAG: tRNA pseudouridine synthase [Bacteroidetes bacterium]|nr:tRNA pseudouridine synthase [Bacteroidota bacterium]